MEELTALLQQINIRLDKIDSRFEHIVNWQERFNIVEQKIVNLENTVEALKEIKVRVTAIEEKISKIANATS